MAIYAKGIKDAGCIDPKQNARLDELENLVAEQGKKIADLTETINELINAIEPVQDLNGEVSFKAINKNYGETN